MLKIMREGAKSTILKISLFGLLLMAMAGLALMDVQGMFRGGIKSDVIASFGGERIHAQEFDRMVQTTLRQQRIKQVDAYRAGLPQQILKQEIDKRLFARAARDLGLVIDDGLAAAQLKEILAPLTAQGMTEKDALARILQTYSLSENQFVAIIKEQLATQQLLATVTSGISAPQQMISDALRYRNEWRDGQYFTLSAIDAGAVKEPSEEELKAFYTQLQGEYALPEYRTLSVLVLDRKVLGDAGKITDAQIRKYYDENIGDYKSPESRLVSQVVANDEATAKKIFDAATKAPGDLAKIAAAEKANYVKPQSVNEAMMPAELAPAAFKAKNGEVLAPVKSPLGWHVMYMQNAMPATTRPFESVKTEIEKTLMQDGIAEQLYEFANKIDDQIAGGKTLTEVAAEKGLKETLLVKIDARGLGADGKKTDAGLPLLDKVIETGFSLKDGASSPLIETPDGAFIIVGVKSVTPAEVQPLERVKSQVLARWKKAHEEATLTEKANVLVERLKKGENFEKIAAESGKPVKSTGLLKRGTKGGDETLSTALFAIEGATGATAIAGDGAVTLMKLSERKVQMPKEGNTAEMRTTEAILTRSLRQDLLEEYRAGLAAKYKVSVNEKLLNNLYAPKEDGEGEAE